MIQCSCLIKNAGYQSEYAYSVDEFIDSDILDDYTETIAKKKISYYKQIATLDIETTTINYNDKPFAYMYQWQFCINNEVVMGNTWGELERLLIYIRDTLNLNEHNRLVVYIHNLAFEFHFMQSFFSMSEVFAVDNHKVLRAICMDAFELRCSYILSNMTLKKFIENSPNGRHLKGSGDLDYRILRTPGTELSPTELGYCYNDVMGLFEAVNDLLATDTVITIPMTSTGYVRRDCRLSMRKNKSNRKLFEKMRLNDSEYRLIKECFRGGNTASNPRNTNRIIKNVNSYDISSSYPYAMLSEEYPMGKFMRWGNVESIDELEKNNKRYCTMGRYIFTDIVIKNDSPIAYIPYSKCNKISTEREVYNGRITSAKFLEISLTNVDYEIIKQVYDFDNLYVTDYYVAKKDYLPIELRQEIIKYFTAKTQLKGIEGSEYEYAKSKNKLNSIYGMSVTNIIQQSWDYNERTQEFDPGEETTLDDFYSSYNNFLSYQWGVWVTAYARNNLQKALNRVGNNVIYCDTDSVKYYGNFDDVFNDINKEIIKNAERYNLQISCEREGERVYLGIYDRENPYEEFITLGAKKYAYIQNGKIGVTVSGLSKKGGAEELTEKGGLKAFRKGEIFKKSGRTVAYYNTEDRHFINVNGEQIETGSNIAIVDTTYTLGITDTMLSIIYKFIEG